MPLLSFWESNPEATSKLTIQQIVSAAGEGQLRDNTKCSEELREYLKQVSSEKIGGYVNHCLANSFPDSGSVLQDLVNELGRRLDFNVSNGLYQGRKGHIGYDGLWKAPESNNIVVEVKTTDAYRISLDTVVRYREKLQEAKEISGSASILIVVGRQDTGELEAQVRGSRHGWDVRIISTDSLIELVKLKESTEEKETVSKIRSLLVPFEYTRLDSLVDIIFTTAKDVETAAEAESSGHKDEPEATNTKGSWEFTDSELLQQKREKIITSIASREATKLIRKTRAVYWNANHDVRIACSISKKYTKQGAYPYWYAYHPQWDDFLSEGKGYFVLGCMDLDIAFAIPRDVMSKQLQYLNTTTKHSPGKMYWHIHLVETTPNHYGLLLPKKSETLPLDDYVIELTSTPD